jgi:SNF2 family DNA or RNA helicase
VEEMNRKNEKPIVYITSYQILEKRTEMFEEIKYKFIVLDEGHIIKNPKSNKFLASKKLNG